MVLNTQLKKFHNHGLMNKIKILDLFSGIGGFSLGFHNASERFETTAFVECDKFCQKVLKKNFPGIPIYEDVKEFKPNEENIKPQIITAGVPCQPFSQAGLQRGKDDDRNLWPETLRIIKESRPTWFIGENVPGIVKLYLDTILKDLESENYSVRCFNIPAVSVGLKHQRKRIFFVAYSESEWSGKSKELDKEKRFEESNTTQSDSSSTDVPNSNEGHAQARRKRQRGIRKESEGERISSDASSLRETLSNSKKVRLQGLRRQGNKKSNLYEEQKISLWGSKRKPEETWWQTQSEILRGVDGISHELDTNHTNRLKAIGNSLCPQIIYLIGLSIMKTYKNNYA